MPKIGNDWDGFLADEFGKSYYQNLRDFLKEEYHRKTIYPNMHSIFNAFKLTPYSDVKVAIIGQDPYINPGEAHGLAFSVLPGATVPPSLVNIFKEISDDTGAAKPKDGNLERWARQGVLLLNSVLTVEAKRSRSHAGKGWEQFTDAAIEALSRKAEPMVFMLWGNNAKAKEGLISNPAHLVLKAAHPSPLARGAFFGCKHFSKANEFLDKHNRSTIEW